MNVAAQQAISGHGALAQAARRLASWLPAFLIAYSALFDPLIHFDGSIYQSYGGIDIGDLAYHLHVFLRTTLFCPGDCCFWGKRIKFQNDYGFCAQFTNVPRTLSI